MPWAIKFRFGSRIGPVVWKIAGELKRPPIPRARMAAGMVQKYPSGVQIKEKKIPEPCRAISEGVVTITSSPRPVR